MTWLIAIVCIILIIYFWRIFLPLAIIAAIGLGVFLLYMHGEMDRNERNRKLAEQTVRERIAKAKATAGDVVREWEVFSETDPASGVEVPRRSSVSSDEGLCQTGDVHDPQAVKEESLEINPYWNRSAWPTFGFPTG